MSRADFDISDRIDVRYSADEAVQAIFAEHAAYIAEETLALSIESGDASDGGASAEVTIDGHDVTLAVTKA